MRVTTNCGGDFSRTLIDDVDSVSGDVIDLQQYITGDCSSSAGVGFLVSIDSGDLGTSNLELWSVLLDELMATDTCGTTTLYNHPWGSFGCQDCDEYGSDIDRMGSNSVMTIRFEEAIYYRAGLGYLITEDTTVILMSPDDDATTNVCQTGNSLISPMPGYFWLLGVPHPWYCSATFVGNHVQCNFALSDVTPKRWILP